MELYKRLDHYEKVFYGNEPNNADNLYDEIEGYGIDTDTVWADLDIVLSAEVIAAVENITAPIPICADFLSENTGSDDIKLKMISYFYGDRGNDLLETKKAVNNEMHTWMALDHVLDQAIKNTTRG